MKVVFLLLDDNFDFFYNLNRARAYVRAEHDVPQDEIGGLTDLDVVIKPFYSLMTFTACTGNSHSVVVIEPGENINVNALIREVFCRLNTKIYYDHIVYNKFREKLEKLVFYVYSGSRYGLHGLTAGIVGVRVPRNFETQKTIDRSRWSWLQCNILWETMLEVFNPGVWRRVWAVILHYETSAPKEWGLGPDELVVRDAEGHPVGAVKMKDVPDPTFPVYSTPKITGRVWADKCGITPANIVHPSFIRFFKTAEVSK